MTSRVALPKGDGWEKARLQGHSLVFEADGGFKRALEDGFFFIEQPEAMDLAAGDYFASNFYLEQDPKRHDTSRGFKRWTPEILGAPYEGYFSRKVDQTEQFFLESRFWEIVYPRELAQQAIVMRAFALDILRASLKQLDLPPELWDQATGCCLTGRGTYHLTFNHFRPDIRARGLNVHKDTGWLTVLRSVEPGLEVNRNGQWCPVCPMPGMFLANFGCAMEILMRSSRSPVNAVAHRVVEQPLVPGVKPDRYSYAMFVDSSLDESLCPGLFRFDPAAGLVLEVGFKAFLDDILTKTYEYDTQGLY